MWFIALLLGICLACRCYFVVGVLNGLPVAGLVCVLCAQIPNVTLPTIPTARHPVKVGLSDAYYIDRPSDAGIGSKHASVTVNSVPRSSLSSSRPHIGLGCVHLCVPCVPRKTHTNQKLPRSSTLT